MNYIVNTGCSYGVMFRSMKEFTKGNDTDFNVIDLHCDSHGAEFQKRSIIYTISKLIKKGVNPKNIFVLVEWSQPNRLFIEAPKEYANHILKNLDNSEGTFILNNKFERLEDSFEFIPKYKSLNTIFGDRVYLNPDVDNFDELENEELIYYLEEFKKGCHISHKPIDRYENYLSNILHLQSYLKDIGIQYVFFLMNNTFEGYYNDFSHIYGKDETYKLFSEDEIILPSLTKLLHIKSFSEYLNEIWESIDLTNFVFYSTEKFKYGGIDEFAMERFGHIAYTSGANEWDVPTEGYVTSFGAHPHDSIYIDFFKDYIYPKIKGYVGEIEFDMNNRWDKSKHNAIRL